MREIKFRAWDKKKSFMLYPDMECEDDSHYTIPTNSMLTDIVDAYIYTKDDIYIDRFPIMQYTGLKDKNGKEIYEGDIVELSRGDIREVRWHEGGAFWFYSINSNANFALFMMKLSGDKDMKVIGNIHENPELLEK